MTSQKMVLSTPSPAGLSIRQPSRGRRTKQHSRSFMPLSLHTVLALLARRDHSKQEIRTKLARRFPDDPNIESIIEQCEAMGYINETRFIEHRVRYLISQGKGPRFIQNDLKQKGITNEMIAKHLTIIDNSWLNVAKRSLMRRFQNQAPCNFKEYARQARFLQQRGFTEQQIKTLLRLTEQKWLPDDDN
jgi:regulatory protein